MQTKKAFINKYGYRVNCYGRHKHKRYIAQHREVALKIYRKNRIKYPLPFHSYEIHHINGNKQDNRTKNLELVLPTDHWAIHNG